MISAWYLPTVISAAALGFYDICKKHAVRDNSVMPVLFFATLSGTGFFVLMTLARGGAAQMFRCGWDGQMLVALKALLVSSSWICVYYAMRELPISLAAPIRSTSPLWTLAGGILLYREIPTWTQALGMAVILTGYMLFTFLGGREGFPWRSRGMRLILAGTLLGAASALYDKYLLNVRRLDPVMLQFFFSLDLVAVLGAAWAVRTRFGHRHPFVWKWSIPATGILLILADFCYFYAVSVPAAPISMISLLRRCSCVVTFFLGAKLFHDVNLKRKAAALVLLLGGAALLALAK